MKRIFDLIVSATGLLILSPIILLVILLIWLYDYHNPLYRPIRVGLNNSTFRMVKFRSMVVNADKVGPTSTSGKDPCITPIGHYIRGYKLDEFSQLLNVFLGGMSLVGPRPQVKSHVDKEYTSEEQKLLNVKPGITDISSIVFSDEGEILKDSTDADLDYNRLIRPWKSRLGLIYVEKQNFFLDLHLIWLTVVAIFNKPAALKSINKILIDLKVDPQLIEVCKRDKPLYPFPPPGANHVVS